ncbi:hypothetical protein MTR_1g090470 [Medicago truncatula]|uniref:Uncharacterized protein n=1 Tax=Medicago truncatula TaxID=3880 RepID=G7ZYD2_MEDTR|nr:hypothetical protein MTR_1g090470 [Medicago truncatula]
MNEKRKHSIILHGIRASSRSIGSSAIKFSLSDHPPFMSTNYAYNVGREGVVTSNMRWSDSVFISGGNLHLINRLCGRL